MFENRPIFYDVASIMHMCRLGLGLYVDLYYRMFYTRMYIYAGDSVSVTVYSPMIAVKTRSVVQV